MDFTELMNKISAKLPIQNPLHSFVHNNVLQMFEGADFHEAVSEASKLYRAHPYWNLEKYLELFKEGKISLKNISDAIDHYLGNYSAIDSIEKMGLSSKDFFQRLMFAELTFNDEEVRIDITDFQLWAQCEEKARNRALVLKRSSVSWRGRHYWEKYLDENVSSLVHPYIIRLVSSYLDQGQSFWANPFVNKGFWPFFIFNVKTTKSFSSDWQKILEEKVGLYQFKSSEEVIQEELTAMGIPEVSWENFLLEMLFDLKGWSGIVNKLEKAPWQAPVRCPALKLSDYIASLLLVESSVDTYCAKKYSMNLSHIYGRHEKIELSSHEIATALYQISKSFQLDEAWMLNISTDELLSIIDQVDEAQYVHRTRLWHEAYEHHFYHEAIQSIASHHVSDILEPPDAYVLFCIDDREESYRRHLEEVHPRLRTYGVVGFFGVDMNFSGRQGPRLASQCPPIMTPRRIVREVSGDLKKDIAFQKWSMKRGGGDLSLYYNSRTLFRGFFSTLLLGILSLIPMFMQVFFPVGSRDLKKKILEMIIPEIETDMHIDSGEEGYGYTKEEMADIVANVLRMCGILNGFPSFVVLIGHGSSSSNNPFKQAYGCGACGGNAGIPNSKAFAKMANDLDVRKILEERGIHIPEATLFVPGFHDTCTDEIQFFNINGASSQSLKNFEKIKSAFNEASRRNAFERCQRFHSFDNQKGPDEALKHVKERSVDLAQPRPEYGHSSNALAIVGRREVTRGMFLNRRAFLHSYDWRIDSDGKILAQVVLGGVTVAVNINMDYYFSCVDNNHFGCGSKLPLNMTSLLGVMTGSQGDLRIGLARQMVEIHEPIRNLTIIEAPLKRVRELFEEDLRLRNLLHNHWMRLAVLDPETSQWHLFGAKKFELVKIDDFPLRRFKSSMEIIGKTDFFEDFAEMDQ